MNSMLRGFTRTLALAASLSMLAGIAAGQGSYEIDSAHSAAQFSVRHMMISNVRGQFNKVSGTFYYDPNDLAASKVEALIDATTINTREPKRDAHLKSADFFDAEKFPTPTFTSTKVWKDGGKLLVKGDLTMHGVTHEAVLDVDGPTPEITDQRGNVRIGATATAKLNRQDWGLNYSRALETGGAVVGDEVTITLDIEAVKKK